MDVPKSFKASVSSIIDVLIMALNSSCPLSPTVAWTLPPNSPVGLVLITLITPPLVFLPNSVPWGPLRISILSRSKFSITWPELVPIATPSNSTRIFGSNDLSDSLELIPLIVIAEPLERTDVSPIITFGAKALKSAMLRIVASSSCSVIAVIAIGTSWSDSSLFCAVTIISSISKPDDASWANEEPMKIGKIKEKDKHKKVYLIWLDKFDIIFLPKKLLLFFLSLINIIKNITIYLINSNYFVYKMNFIKKALI